MDHKDIENTTIPTPNEKSLRLISINKASKIFRIRHQSVKKMLTTGKIRYVKVGKRLKIPYMNLVKFIEEKSIQRDYVLSAEEVSRRIDELILEYRKVG